MQTPFFNDTRLEADFVQSVQTMKLPEGAELIRTGEVIRFIPIVKSGCIRVLRQDEEGREVFLYHIMPGETCAMSITCCNTMTNSEIHAIAEEPTEIYTIPVTKVDAWSEYKEWRNYIAYSYKTRFERLLHTIDEIAFEHMDDRLLSYLKARTQAKGSDVLAINHEEIAHELNIQRESATRLLKKLKDLGYLETGRGFIKLTK